MLARLMWHARPAAILLLVSVCALSVAYLLSQSTPAAQWSVGYWTPWGNPQLPPSAIQWNALTHVVYWGGLVNPDGTLDLDTQQVTTYGSTLVSAAHANGVKAILSIVQPYWWGNTDYLEQATDSYLATLVSNIMNAVTAYGFDGVDIDWEPFSASTNGPALLSLASALRSSLGTKILTADAIVTDSAYWGSAQSYFDRVNVMTYDLTGTWNPYSWHNAALYDPDGLVFSVNLAVHQFTASGVPPAKLSIGIPFYGWQWAGGQLQSDPSQGVTQPQQQWSLAPTLEQSYYQDLASMINPQNYQWDSLARVPYLRIVSLDNANSQFITYDNEQSVTEKVNYVKNNGLGGWIIWELVGDYLPYQSPTQPLLNAIAIAQSGSANIVP